MTLLSWQSLIFLIPIGVGTILAIGAAFAVDSDGVGGAGHAGPEHGLGAGFDHDHDHGPAALPDGGRVPITIRLMLATLTFGGVGLAVSYLFGGEAPTPSTLATVGAGVGGLVGSLFVSRLVARLFAQRWPLLETETIGRRDLLGSTGRAVLPLGPAGGVVQVHDRRGNLHQLPCRTLVGEPALPVGAPVLLVDYDEGRGVYRATTNPLTTRGRY
jgi:hypothetical protein